MSILKILEKSIERCAPSYSGYLAGKNGTDLIGCEFMLFSLSKIFGDKEIDDIEEGIVDSLYRQERYDFGIDAVYITGSNEFIEQLEDLDDFNEDTEFKIQLFQFKRGTGISQADVLKFKSGIEKVLINEEISDSDNLYFYNRMSVLNEIKEKIYESFPSENVSVVCYVVFSGMANNIHNDPIVSKECVAIEESLHSNGYTNTRLEVVDCQYLIKDPSRSQNITDIIEYEKTFKYITDTEQSQKLNGYISILKGSQIAELVRKHQASIFEANIRDYFKRSDLNSKIIETCSDQEEAKFFWSYNNGLTMTCSKVEELPSNKYKLHNLQIVNGCQTSNAIYNAVKNREKVIELKKKVISGEVLTRKENDLLSKVERLQFDDETTLLLKIIETSDQDLIYKITETTNSQTPIKTFSLKANDDVQILIEKYLEEYGVSYERRVNELKNKGRKNIYSIQKLFQLYTSHILFMPSQAKTTPKRLFVNNYDNVFPSPNVKAMNYLLYYFPILVDTKVNEEIKRYQAIDDVDAYKKTLFSYGKFHLGCFLFSSILKGEYNEKGIIKNEALLKKGLTDDLEKNFLQALEDFERLMKNFAGSKKESIAGAVRRTDLDEKIVRFIKSQK